MMVVSDAPMSEVSSNFRCVRSEHFIMNGFRLTGKIRGYADPL